MDETLTHLQALEHSTWQEFYAKGKELQQLKKRWIAAYDALKKENFASRNKEARIETTMP